MQYNIIRKRDKEVPGEVERSGKNEGKYYIQLWA
nr:MAG TPA: hypothetical protein [Caudoviricetes sp.]